MKVILLSDVYKHGVAGEVVEVTDGFARNWLIPKKLGVKATDTALKQAASLRAQADARRAALDERLNDLGRQINGVELVFGRRASPTGKLFGSVTTTEIAELLNKQTGIDINRRRISQQSLREIGTHEVPVRLGSEVSPVLKIIIVREEEYESFMAARAAGQHPEVEEVRHETREAAAEPAESASAETENAETASAAE